VALLHLARYLACQPRAFVILDAGVAALMFMERVAWMPGDQERAVARDMIGNMSEPSGAKRDVWRSMWRGFLQKCPSCGKGSLFHRYLKVSPECPACGEELHHQRADDAPAYFTIVIVGHVIVGGVLAAEKAFKPSTLTHLALWLPLTLASTLWLLPRVKGALVGLQWALRMHGFGGVSDEIPPAPRRAAE
jgi:uncharacterized protein (DUF983 family)